MASPTAPLPTSGTYPVNLSASLFPGMAKKRKRETDELIAMKYTFKPASMNSITDAAIITNESGSKMLRADTSSHGTQAFDIREEQSKARECVLIYDPTTSSFTLHDISTTAHLTLNRSGASATARPSTSHSETSSASASSASQPLAQRRSALNPDDPDADPAGPYNEEDQSTPQPPKRKRASEVPRPTTGGKALPRKTAPVAAAPPPHAAIPDFSGASSASRGKSTKVKPVKATGKKAGAGKGKKKPPIDPQGKFKSAEIIEDSEEEYDLRTSEVGDDAVEGEGDGDGAEEEDDFAKMLGESLAEDADEVGEEEEEDEDDEEDEEDEEEYDDALEGARVVTRQPAVQDSEEWL